MIQNNSLSSQTKFNPNQIKNTEVKNLEKNNGLRRNIVADYHRCNLIMLSLENKSHKILFTNGRFWLVGLVGRKIIVGILNSFYVVITPLSAPIPNFIQIGQKTQKLEIFTFGRFWLVWLVGRKLVVGILNSFYVVFAPLLAPIPNFMQIG